MTLSALDRPIWHALAARQHDLGEGTARARRFAPDISPFAASVDNDPGSLAELAALIPPGGSLALAQAGQIALPVGTVAEKTSQVVQMVVQRAVEVPITVQVHDLSPDDAAEMLALATLTVPGPFLSRTHLFGGFCGIKEQGRLMAMAGERLKVPGLTEVSGVCTHPDARGRGYARMLSAVVANRIAARGETAFLHSYAANTAAIALYESLGFGVRADINLVILRRGGEK